MVCELYLKKAVKIEIMILGVEKQSLGIENHIQALKKN